MAVAFSSSAEDVVQRRISSVSKSTLIPQRSSEDIRLCFELDRCTKWIHDHELTRVALQFPDDLLPVSVFVAKELERRVLKTKLYILGDTSFGSCCVDELAAEHAACQGVIHFGHSCLSPPSRLKVLFVLGVHPRDWSALDSLIKSSEGTIPFQADATDQRLDNDEFLVIIDTEYCSQIAAIREKLPDRAVIGVPIIPGDEVHENEGQVALRRRFATSKPLNEFKAILWIGGDSHALVNVLLHFSFATIWSYDPDRGTLQREGLTISKSLMRRHYLVEKAKDAQIIGILVGTLGVRNYLKAISHLRELIRKAGRKSYTLAVGKLNVAKLANFQEIDIYVYVACPENTFFDSKEFYRPVVTPYELEVALNPNREWGSSFSTDFNDILPGGPAHVAFPKGTETKANYDMSLISGKMRSLGKDQGEPSEEAYSDRYALVEKPDGTVAMAPAKGAGGILAHRSWQGLDPGSGESVPPSQLKEGRSGVAMAYTHEKHP